MKIFEFFKGTNNLSDFSVNFLFEALPLSALVLYCFMLRQKKLSTYINQDKTINQEKQNIASEHILTPVRCSMIAEYEATQLLKQLYENQGVKARPSGLAPPSSLKKYVKYKMADLLALQEKGASLELSYEQAYDYFLILYFFISRKRDKYTNDINYLKSIPAICELWTMKVVCETMTSEDLFTACTAREASDKSGGLFR